MHMTRRALLSATASASALALAACTAGQTAQQVTAAVLADLSAVASGLGGILPQLGGIAGIAPATIALAQTIIGDVKSVASQVSAGMTAAAAQPLVQRIESDVQSLVTALGTIDLPALIANVVKAAQVLVPVIAAAVGLLLPAAATPTGMTPDVARNILHSAS